MGLEAVNRVDWAQFFQLSQTSEKAGFGDDAPSQKSQANSPLAGRASLWS